VSAERAQGTGGNKLSAGNAEKERCAAAWKTVLFSGGLTWFWRWAFLPAA